jgi:hypothetical protein
LFPFHSAADYYNSKAKRILKGKIIKKVAPMSLPVALDE